MRSLNRSRHRKSLYSLALGAVLLMGGAVGATSHVASAAGGNLPDLVVSIAPNPAVVQPNAPVDWVVTASNIGTGDAKTPVFVDVNYNFAQGKAGSGVGWTCSAVGASRTSFDYCSIPSLAAGASATFTIPNTAIGYAGTYPLTATVDQGGTVAESNEANNTATGSYVVPVNGPSDLVPVVLASYPVTVPLLPLEQVTYSIETKSISTYAGPVTTSITDALPAGFTFVSYLAFLSNGAPSDATCTAVAELVTCTGVSNGDGNFFDRTEIQIVAQVPAATGLVDYVATNTVTVDSANTIAESNETNNTLTTTTPVSNTLPDLQLAISTQNNPVTAGGVVTHLVTLTNVGTATATVATVTFGSQAGAYVDGGAPGVTCVAHVQVAPRYAPSRCRTNDLAPGSSVTFPVQFQAPGVAGTTTTFGEASTGDVRVTPIRELAYDNNNASAPVVVAVGAPADLAATLTVGGVSAPAENTAFNVNAQNVGIGQADPTTVQATLPAGFVFTSGSDTAGSCTAVGPIVNCPVGSLAPGAAQPITINATALTTVGSYVAAVTIDPTNSVSETDETNNTASATAVVSAAFADLTTVVTGPATAALNAKPTYVVSTKNIGNVATGPNTLTVNLRGYDRIGSVVAPAGYVCTVRKAHLTGGIVDCAGSALAVGATTTLTVSGASPYSAGTWPVTATADSLATVHELSETNNTSVFNTVVG
jgi:hypothetical protein